MVSGGLRIWIKIIESDLCPEQSHNERVPKTPDSSFSKEQQRVPNPIDFQDSWEYHALNNLSVWAPRNAHISCHIIIP